MIISRVELDLGKIFCDEIVVSILKTEIERYVVQTCGKQYEQSWLGGENDVLGKVSSKLQCSFEIID